MYVRKGVGGRRGGGEERRGRRGSGRKEGRRRGEEREEGECTKR